MFRRSEPHVDPILGELTRHRGSWRGTISLGPFTNVALVLPGSRSTPDPEALDLARVAGEQFEAARGAILRELDDHRLVYEAASPAPDTLPPVFVTVTTLERQEVLEFGYRVPWDEEHTLGARVRDGELIELCGSVVSP